MVGNTKHFSFQMEINHKHLPNDPNFLNTTSSSGTSGFAPQRTQIVIITTDNRKDFIVKIFNSIVRFVKIKFVQPYSVTIILAMQVSTI